MYYFNVFLNKNILKHNFYHNFKYILFKNNVDDYIPNTILLKAILFKIIILYIFILF